MTDKTTEVLTQYLANLKKALSTGDATEHTHRPALKALIEGLVAGVTATNEPKHIKCGAPDYIVRKGVITVGYIEAKDIGVNLGETEKTEQLKRYRDSLSNLVLTDYVDFRWYVDGDLRLKASLGTVGKDNRIKQDADGINAVTELLNGFLAHKAKDAGTPKELATRMAKLAHMIRNLIKTTFENEPDTGSLHSQIEAFRDNLIPDLTVEQFADMYAQTIAYGLFAARCADKNAKEFTRQKAIFQLPKTNPFLRKLFNTIAGPDLDESIAWAVDDLAQILEQADMAGILENFGKHTGKEDPVVHFYETFLQAYDPKVREMRGVYYTPEPVVSYIVRSIDHILKTRFNKPMGLADENTLILDPATGTATFLYMVINEIHKSFTGQEGMWDNYVSEKLLKRIFGFELLMAPYAIAHLKLGLQLQETGYKFGSDQRLGIYMTNTLDEAVKVSEMLPGFNKYIVDEANEAAEIKKEKPIMVVLGNPPYSVSSMNRSAWIDKLLDDYKKDLNEKKLNLDDDYIKFIRFAQWRIEKTGHGILAFITNNSYLDGLTHRRMRECLINSFTDIYILNLHGNSRRKEQAPDNSKDENVFDIQQGVSICLCVKEPNYKGKKHIHYADIWGLRDSKYLVLFDNDIDSTEWETLKPSSPSFYFVPKDFSLKNEYENYQSAKDIFLIWQSALNTDRDELFLDSDKNELNKRIQLLFSKKYGEDFKDKYRIFPSSSYDIEKRRDKTKFNEDNIQKCLHRPFDECHIYYDPKLTSRPVYEVMRHMLQNNIALICARQSKEEFAALITSALCTHKIVTVYDRSFVFPLYLYPTENEMNFDIGKRRPNLNPEFVNELTRTLGLKFIGDGKGDLQKTFGPEDIFNYAYAVFHAPTYRTRYAEFLKIDFPRLPLTSDKVLFKTLAGKGAELVSLHLMESAALNQVITTYPVKGDNVVEKVFYAEKEQRVYINKTQYFEGVPLEVWNFHVGGYQVCEKWLKDRKGRTFTYDELTHYQKVVVALKETIRLMAEIDKAIPSWPIT